MRRPGMWAALVTAGVVLVACADGVTEPGALNSARLSVSASDEAPGRKEYACFFSVRESSDPLWYRYASGTTRFPRSAEAADGATTTYRYRSHDEAGQVVRVVRCTIPRTERAAQIMDRRLSVERAGTDAGGVVLMDVELEGLVVRACQYGGEYPNCEPAPGSSEPETDVLPCLDWADCNGGDTDPDPTDIGGGLPGGEEPEPDQPTPCNTGDAPLDDPTVATGMQTIWAGSSPDANLLARAEKGGWVVQTATGYRIEAWPITASFCGGDFTVGWPPEGPGAIVGFILTHPYAVGENVLTCSGMITQYNGDPSDVDRNTSAALGQQLGRNGGLPGYIIDKNGITVYHGWVVSADTRFGRCAY